MVRLGVCVECKKEKEIHAHGKCYKCYRREYTQPEIVCKICGKKEVHHGRGICKKCYIRRYYKKNPDLYKAHNIKRRYNIPYELWNEITKRCIICGFDKVVELHHLDKNHKNNNRENFIGLCPNHHKMLHNFKYSKNMKKEIKKRLLR